MSGHRAAIDCNISSGIYFHPGYPVGLSTHVRSEASRIPQESFTSPARLLISFQNFLEVPKILPTFVLPNKEILWNK